jgi:hypothetical protein
MMTDTSRPQLHDHQYIEDAESGGHYDHEITDHDRLGVVVDEDQPPLFRVPFPARASRRQVLVHRSRRNPDPQLQLQFVGDAFLYTGGILSPQFPDQLPKVLGQARSPCRFRLPAPEEPESSAVSADQSVWLHIDQRIAPMEHLAVLRRQGDPGSSEEEHKPREVDRHLVNGSEAVDETQRAEG